MAEGKLKSVEQQLSGSGVMLVGRTLFNRQDYNADLQGANGIAKYERMRRDPEIASGLMRWKAPLLSANWTIEEPNKPGKSIKDQMELCERYVMGKGASRVQNTFQGGLLPQILLMLDFGVSAVEKVWGVNEKGQQVYARLAPIGPQTISEFVIGDMGEVKSLVQWAYTTRGFQRQEIPDPAMGGTAEEKLAVFTYRQEGDNYFGRPILRELYQAWFHKSELWTLDGLQKERHGMGLTVIKIPNSITDPTSGAYLAAQKLAQELRSHERQGAVIGSDWELQQIFPTGAPPDILGSQKYCDEQIARAMANEESQLGSAASGGSRALSESKTNNSMLMLQALSNMIEEQVNTQLIPILVERNFGPQGEYPRLKCEDLDKMTGGQQADIVKTLKDAGMIKYDRKLEEHFRETNDLPEIDDATREEPLPPVLPGGAPGGPGPMADGSTSPKPTPDQAPPPESKPAQKASGMPLATSLRRDLLPHEQSVEFERIQAYLDKEPMNIWHRVVAPFRAQIIQRVAAAASSATDTALSRGQLFGAEERRPLEKRLSDELTAALMRVYATGRLDVKQERAKQLALGKADGAEDDEDETTPAQTAWLKNLASGFVALTYLSLISEATRQALTSRQAELPKAEVERRVMLALADLSVPVQQANLDGVVGRIYQNGRIDQGNSYGDEIGSVFYAAVLDSGTCGPCEARDGEEIDADQVASMIPNPDCEGGDRCRCQPVYVFRPQTQPEAA